ncbi:MAG: flavodoxin family protein [Acidimicrobiia bacterium]|nr:flavodoxin family protein [Acidimicrobiia bacterium]
MKAVLIYETLTGNTRRAAHLIADELYRHRIGARLFSTAAVEAEAVARADLVIVGTWTDGLLVVGQRPGRKGRLRRSLPDLSGKRCAVYCTYAIDSGHTLDKLTAVCEQRGAEVVGGLAIRRDRLVAGSHDFVDRLTDALVT